MPPPGLIAPKPRESQAPVEPIQAVVRQFTPTAPAPQHAPSFVARDVELTAQPGEWQLVFADGRRTPLAGSVVIGRDPVAPTARPDARALSIDDPARSLSKTHVLVDVEGGRVFVQELNSTNGIVVTSATGIRNEMPAGSRRQLASGDCIALGDVTLWLVRE